jgi:hypothetical protein
MFLLHYLNTFFFGRYFRVAPALVVYATAFLLGATVSAPYSPLRATVSPVAYWLTVALGLVTLAGLIWSAVIAGLAAYYRRAANF